MSKIITNCYSNIYVQNEVLTNTKYIFNSKMNKDYHGENLCQQDGSHVDTRNDRKTARYNLYEITK